MRHGSYRLYLVLALILLLAGLRIGSMRQIQAEQPLSSGKFTRQAILARTDRLYPLLAPLTHYYRSSSTLNPSPDGTRQHTWTVECLDTTDTQTACFVWDADTGDLCSVSRATPPPQERLPTCLTPRQAVQASQLWLNALWNEGMSHGWKLASEPVEFSHTWAITLQGESHAAFFVINKYSGALIRANYH